MSASAQGLLTSGGNHEGSIGAGGSESWSFEAQSGDQILLRVGQLSGGNAFAPRLRLYNPDGNLIDSAAQVNPSTSSDAELAATSQDGGTFTVVVDSEPNRADGIGDYRLHYLRLPAEFTVPDGDQGGPLAGGPVKGRA